jgi:hypothetical protein
VASTFPRHFLSTLNGWWREQTRQRGARRAASLLLRNLWSFAQESTPEQRRQRYGDMDYDWEHRVNTTGGTVGWRARLLGVFHSPYQPTEPTLFREMMAALPIALNEFTFVDLGSGKGRTLLMASEYPFRRIVGVELIEELHRAAEENIRAYSSATRQCTQIESLCMDAGEFVFPETALLLYLFNPLPEAGLRRVMRQLEQSLEQMPRPIWIVHHNPVLDNVLAESRALVRTGGTEQYSIFRSEPRGV